MYVFHIFQNLTGRFILATFSLPKIHQNPQQQQNNHFSNRHSRSRGVATINFGIPMLHGDRFFWSACNMGMPKLIFATPLERDGDYFHYFNTSPARNSLKNDEMQFSNHCFGVMLLTTRFANRHEHGNCLWWEIYETKIVFYEKWRILSRILHFPNEI